MAKEITNYEIIEAGDWEVLERGLAQRVRLMNLLAADLYGPQRLWRKGILDSSLIYSNPDFLQVAWQTMPSNGLYVHLMASDLLRDEANSTWMIAHDELQVPHGLGKALELRLKTSRANADLFRGRKIQRLAWFFKTLRDNLESLSSNAGAKVLLASGPASPWREEDAVLSDYLSLPLVENDDLAVRSLKVYMKTLCGLKPISSIFRRADDVTCDPLELRVDAGEGAVGLISTIREGNVGIMNFLGTGALECALFKPCMERIARELMGEDLIIKDVESVALEAAADRARVLDTPEDWCFVPAFGRGPAYDYRAMTASGQLALMRRILSEPASFVALRRPPSDKTYRFFAMNKTPAEAMVMPGGTTSANEDLWVASGRPVSNFSMLSRADEPIVPTRAGGDLPSRAASDLSQLGRTMAIIDVSARIARGLARRLADENWPELPEIIPLARMLQADDPVGGVRETSGNGEAADVLRCFTVRKDYKFGLQARLEAVRGKLPSIRDRISEDLHAALASLAAEDAGDEVEPINLLPYLNRLLARSAQISGLCSESMTRGHEWRFQEIGKRIELSLRTLGLVAGMVPAANSRSADDETALIAALLEVGDARLTYRRRYGARLQAAPVIDLLLCDETNPRSVAYQIVRLRDEAKQLPRQSGSDAVFSPLDKVLIRLLADLRLADCGELFAGGLREFTGNCRRHVAHAGDLLARAYLDHAPHSEVVHALATEV
ncbi:MAG: circularly permuted type 2 ATP-grasp protein [Kiritimatiellia bacterium]